MKIVDSIQMKKYENEAIKVGISEEILMDNAGKSIAQTIISIKNFGVVTVLVGPGNNGGDGLVVAKSLSDNEWVTRVIFCGKRKSTDKNTSLILKNKRVYCMDITDGLTEEAYSALATSDVIVDSIFGTGQNRALSGIYAEVLDAINEITSKNHRIKVVATDIPTGINSDTGLTDPHTIMCDYTITLGLPKQGLFNTQAAAYAGKIITTDIFIPRDSLVGCDYESPTFIHELNKESEEFLTKDLIQSLLPTRTITSHKGTYGKMLSITGSDDYPGAAVLNCGAALRSGVGLLAHASSQLLKQIIASNYPETTFIKNDDETILTNFDKYDSILIGCGLGKTDESRALIKKILPTLKKSAKKCVIDADGLNILSESKTWYKGFKQELVLTPHVAEMARLMNVSIDEVQANRIENAQKCAKLWKHIVVLKGAYTVIASPEGYTAVSPFANPALSTAGTGDVLAGIIASFLAQGLSPFNAALCGVYLHGEAAEERVMDMGNTGMIASDLITQLPYALDFIKYNEYEED